MHDILNIQTNVKASEHGFRNRRNGMVQPMPFRYNTKPTLVQVSKQLYQYIAAILIYTGAYPWYDTGRTGHDRWFF